MSVSVRPEVNARDIAKVARVLRSVDKNLIDDLRKPMKAAITPIAGMIQNRVNANPAPMSRMTKPGRLQWKKLTARVSITPGYSRKSPNLVTIDMGKSNAAGVAIAENAGSKSAGKSARGQIFIRQLKTVVPGWDNGGRFVYRAFMPYKLPIYRLAENILERWTESTNRKLENL